MFNLYKFAKAFIPIFSLLLFISACESQQKIEEDISDKLADDRVSAEKLCKDYEANEVAADEKYKGKILIVDGTVKDIEKGIFDEIYVTLEGDKDRITSVKCYFSDAHKSRLARLTKDQKVSIKGKCDGKTFDVVLKGCTFF